MIRSVTSQRLSRTEHRVLFLCSESFPPHYAVLDCIFNDALRNSGIECSWIMPSAVTSVVRETWNGHAVWLIPKVRTPTASGMMAAYREHLSNIESAVQIAAHEVGPFDLVQVRDDPAMAAVGYRHSRHQRIPFAYQLSHLKEEECILAGLRGQYPGRAKHIAKGAAGFLARQSLLYAADVVFPVSQEMGKLLYRLGISRSKIAPLPEGVNIDGYQPATEDKKHKTRELLHLPRGPLAIYIGSLSIMRRLDRVVDAMVVMNKLGAPGHVAFLGGDAGTGDIERLRHRAQALGVAERLRFLGHTTPSKVPPYLQACDVGLSPIPNTFVYRHCSPIKILEYLSVGLPVVATDIPAQRQILERADAGLLVAHEPDSIAHGLAQLFTMHPADRQLMGQRGREYIVGHRSYADLARIVVDRYQRLWEQPRDK
ncbi:MAG: glycosyltransferase [Nannocystaceae bacterium]